MNNLFNQHLQAMRLVLGRMGNNKLATLMMSLVIAVALCLPSLFYMGVDHLSQFASHVQNETEVSVFLKLDVDKSSITEVAQVLAKNDGIQQFHLVTKEEAWLALKEKAQNSKNLDSQVTDLEKNPLPDAFFIKVKSIEPKSLDALKKELEAIPSVEHVLFNSDWVKRLSALLLFGKRAVLFASFLLAVALLVMIGNAIRMQVLTQKDEIIVSKLIGASSRFIRIPFLYSGALYGFFGGILTIIMLMFVVQMFNFSVQDLSHLYGSDFSLPIVNADLFMSLLSFTIFIGWFGSYVAVSRAIASIKMN